MVRKHSEWARSKMKRSRPKTKAPKTGWVIAELSQISGMPVRRLRDYVFRDLIQPLERRGTATRYQRSQLVRLIAIKRMRAELDLDLAEIKRRMDAMGERELEAWILSAPLPPVVLEALGQPGANPSSVPVNGAAVGGMSGVAPNPWFDSGASDPAGQPSPAAWFHLELLPGLVLQVSATASPAIKNAAKRIYDEYVGR